MKATEIQENIAYYMNSRSSIRQYSAKEVGAIRKAVQKEYYDRKKIGLVVDGRSIEGKLIINKRIAQLVNNELNPKILITAEDVKLCKVCLYDEYSDRTGKCAWGFKDVRKRLGYDPDTGLEMEF